MTTPPRSLATALLLSFALLHTGCIEFERQILSYRVDAKNDRLLIFQNYQGIYAGEHADRVSEQEIAQLRSVLESERTFFFSNWIFEFNVDAIHQYDQRLAETETQSQEEQEMVDRIRKALKALTDNLTINNGSFFLNEEGKLSGTQTVRIDKLRAVIAAVDDGIRAGFQRRLLREEIGEEERSAITASLARQKPFLRINGNQFHYRHPATKEAYEKNVFPSEDPDARRQKLNHHRKAGVVIRYTNGDVQVAIGAVKDRITRISLKTFDKPYRENVLRYLETSRIPVEPEFDAEMAAKDFLAGR